MGGKFVYLALVILLLLVDAITKHPPGNQPLETTKQPTRTSTPTPEPTMTWYERVSNCLLN